MLLSILAAASPPAAVAEPTWLLYLRSLAPLVTALVAIAVALAAYYRFVRYRVLKPRLSLELSGRTTILHRAHALHVEVVIRNDGQTAVVLDPCFTQMLTVFLADEPVWSDACRSDDGVVVWYDGESPHRELAVLEDRGIDPYRAQPFASEVTDAAPAQAQDDPTKVGRLDRYVLEPGEQERRALLVPVGAAHSYLLQLTIHACGHAGRWWGARRHRRCASRDAVPYRWLARAIVCREDRQRRWLRWT